MSWFGCHTVGIRRWGFGMELIWCRDRSVAAISWAHTEQTPAASTVLPVQSMNSAIVLSTTCLEGDFINSLWHNSSLMSLTVRLSLLPAAMELLLNFWSPFLMSSITAWWICSCINWDSWLISWYRPVHVLAHEWRMYFWQVVMSFATEHWWKFLWMFLPLKKVNVSLTLHFLFRHGQTNS